MRFTLSKTGKGYLLGAIAASTYGLNPLFTLPLYAEGMNADSVLGYRYGIAAVLLGLIMWITHRTFRLTRRQLPLMTIFSLLFAFSSWLLFESFRYMDAGVASTILFIYPVIVAVINAVFYGERISIVTITSILLAGLGILCLYGGDGETTLNPTGTLLVLGGAFAYAVYMVAINRTVLRDVPSVTMTFYSVAIGQLVYWVRLFIFGGLSPIEGALSWVCILSIAIFPTVVSLIAMAIAIHNIGSTVTAILGALEPVTALLIGVIVFGERLGLSGIVGVFLVLTAVMLLVVAKPLLRILRQIWIAMHHRLSQGV
ncbi:MAG: DMT family transporter [Muribaculum sp.]|nr:DMT family transporter [Muribaculum sp.]